MIVLSMLISWFSPAPATIVVEPAVIERFSCDPIPVCNFSKSLEYEASCLTCR
jgi:hypothetical protein